MPKTTRPAPTHLRNRVSVSDLADHDTVEVWDQSTGTKKHVDAIDFAGSGGGYTNWVRVTRNTFIVSGATTYAGADPNGEYTWTPDENAYVKGDFKIYRNVSGVTTTWYLYRSDAQIGTRVDSSLVGQFINSDTNYGDYCEVAFGTRAEHFSGVLTDISDILNECAYGDHFAFGDGTFTYSGLPYNDSNDAIGNHKFLQGGLVLQGAGMYQTTIKLVLADHSTNDGGAIFQALRTSGRDQILDLTVDANAEANITTIGVFHQGIGSENSTPGTLELSSDNTTAGDAGVTAQVETLVTTPLYTDDYVGTLDVGIIIDGTHTHLGSFSRGTLEPDASVSSKIFTLVDVAAVNTLWTVADTGTSVTLTSKTALADDPTLSLTVGVRQVETLTTPSSLLGGYVGDLSVTVTGSGFATIDGTVELDESHSTTALIAEEILTVVEAPAVQAEWEVSRSGSDITLTRIVPAANDSTLAVGVTHDTEYLQTFTFPARDSVLNTGLGPHYGCFVIRGENTLVQGCRFIGWTGGGADIWTGGGATREQYANSDSGRYTVFDGCVFEDPVNVAKDNPYTNALSCRFGGTYRNNTVHFPETEDDFWVLGDGSTSGAPVFAFGVHDNTIFENNIALNCECMFHRDTLPLNHCVIRGNHAYNVCYGVLFQMTSGDVARNITIENNTFEVRALNTTGGRGILFSCNHSSNATFGVTIHNNTIIGESASDYGILMGNNNGGLAAPPFMEGVTFLNNTTGYMTDKTTSTRVFDGAILNTFQGETDPDFPLNYSLQEGFYGVDKIERPDITGVTGSNTALEDLLTKLANLGLITDSTTSS